MKRLLSCIFLMVSAVFAAENLLENPAFKNANAAGLPQGWRLSGGTTVVETKDGVVTVRNEKDRPLFLQNIRKDRVHAGAMYRFTAKIRGEKKGLGQLYIEWHENGPDGKVIYHAANGAPFGIENYWKPYTFTFSLPEYRDALLVIGGRNPKLNVQIKEPVLAETQVLKMPFGGYFELPDDAAPNTNEVVATRPCPAKLRSVPVTPGKIYSLTYDAVGEGETGNDYPFHEMVVQAEPRTLQGGYFFNDVKNTPMPKAQKITIPADFKQKTIDFSFQANTAGKIHFSNFAFKEFVPDPTQNWLLALDEPFYRDMIYSSTDNGRIAGQILAGAPAATAHVDVKTVGEVTVPLTDGKASFVIPAANLAVGDYALTCRILDASGKELKRFERKLTKLAPGKIEITVNRKRYLVINGKPFFPITQWKMIFIDSEDAMHEAALHGINSTIIHVGKDASKTLATLDMCQKFGVKAIVAPDTHARNLSPKVLKETADRLAKALPLEVREHPAVLGYFLIDEPLWAGMGSAPLKATYELFKKLDPYHPVWINAAPRNEVEDLRPYGEACDIYGCDIYPIPWPNGHSGIDDKGITSVGKYTARMNDVTYWRKPIFMALQGFAWAGLTKNNPVEKHVYPTEEQLRFMNYDTFLNGGSVGWWGTQYIKSKEFYRAMYNTALELHALSGLLLEGEQWEAIKTDNDDVRVIPVTWKGNTYYFVQNMVDKANTVSFAVKGPEQSLFVRLFSMFSDIQPVVYYTGEKLAVADGKVTLKLAPYQPMCLGTAALPAPSWKLPAPDATRKADAIETYVEKTAVTKKTVPYDGDANWIWHNGLKRVAASVVMCSKTFELADVSKDIILRVAADDEARIFVNGKEVPYKLAEGWSQMEALKINGYVKAGKNRVVIKALDAGVLPCGLLADIAVGGKVIVQTDDTWLARPSSDNDMDVATEAGYEPAGIVCGYGGGEWKKGVGILVK